MDRPRWFWWELLQAAWDRGLVDEALIAELPLAAGPSPLISDRPLKALGVALYALPPSAIARVQAVLADRLQGDLPSERMEADHVRRLAAAGQEIGFYTLQHPFLPALDDSEVERALIEGCEALEAIVGAPLAVFAYPSGGSAPRLVEASRRLGYSAAFTTRKAPVTPADDSLALGRTVPQPGGAAELSVEASGRFSAGRGRPRSRCVDRASTKPPPRSSARAGTPRVPQAASRPSGPKAPMAPTRLTAPSTHDPVDTILGDAAILEVARPADRAGGRAEGVAIGERGLGSWALARLAADSAALAAGWLAAVALARDLRGAAPPALLCAVPALVLITLLVREAASRRLRAQAGEELRIAVTAAAVSTLAVSIPILLSDSGAAMLQDLVEGGLLAAVAVTTTRVALAWTQAALRHRRGAGRRTLIVGSGRVGRLVAARLQSEPGLGLRPIGFLDKEPLDDAEGGVVLPVFGASWDLEETVRDQRVDAVVVAFSTAPHHVGLSIVHRCWKMGVQVILVPRLFEVQGVRAQSEHIGGLPLVALNPADPRSWQLRARYALDRLLAAAGLLVLSPLLGAIALAVRLKMGRPVLFRQARMGRDGQVFDMLKFRTMAGDPGSGGEADAGWAAQMVDAAEPGQSVNGANGRNGDDLSDASVKSIDIARPSTGGDRRTPLGRMLRRLSLDELPQLWNVVRGEMALIGPRPERVSYADEFARAVYRYRDRARIKPGITGWAQVNGLRGKTSLADRVEWDNFYIENWSPWLDAKILAKTLARATTSDE
ncbi:hypothetical protein BH20ACT18_BH20ACT18_11710 [soil metagenome]